MSFLKMKEQSKFEKFVGNLMIGYIVLVFLFGIVYGVISLFKGDFSFFGSQGLRGNTYIEDSH